MIIQYYRRVYEKLVINPLGPLIQKCTPAVVILMQCTIALFISALGYLSILGTNGFFWVSLIIVLFNSCTGFLRILDDSLPRLHTPVNPKGSLLQMVCDRFLEIVLLISYYYLDTDKAFYCLWGMGVIFVFLTLFVVLGSMLKKRRSRTKNTTA